MNASCLVENLDIGHGDENNDPIGVVNYRTVFQKVACREKKITITCPFSGKRIDTNQSFVLPQGHGFVFYRFSSTEIFYLITGYPWSGFGKIGFYFPSSEIIIGYLPSFGDGRGDAAVNLFKAYSVAHVALVNDYIKKVSLKKSAIWVGHHNFAHHYWNDLPAIETALEEGLLKSVSRLFVTYETLGPLKSIFPEIPENLVKKIKPAELFRATLAENMFIIRIGKNYITQGVANRVLKLSKLMCMPKILEEVQQARKQNFPLLWVSVRVGNRTWRQQEEGLVRIISELYLVYPKLGVVFDGFSIGHGMKISTITKNMIERLHDEVKRIRQRVPQEVAFYDTVGCGIHESIVWADQIDLYICHHGTLQHKVGWIANKPGVVHTNRVTHTMINEVEQATFARENAVIPVYINPDFVKDVTIEYNDGRKNLHNYDLDWKVIFRELRPILSSTCDLCKVAGHRKLDE